jgi:hypothetical protein
MSDSPRESVPPELLRLKEQPLPEAAHDASPLRRERLVRKVGLFVADSAARARRRQRVTRALFGLGLAAALVLLIGVGLQVAQHRGGAMATLAKVTGSVIVSHGGERRLVDAGELRLRDGSLVQSAAASSAELRTAKTALVLAEATELELSLPDANEERIALRSGRVVVQVDKGVAPRRAVVIQTPHAEVLVRGTRFEVLVEPRGGRSATEVHVSAGSVWVLERGEQVALLTAGQSWSSTPAAVSAPAATADVREVAPTAPALSEAAKSLRAPPQQAQKPRAEAPVLGTLAEENRLFAAGLEARNRGDYPASAESFGELLARYPQTALRELAQVERLRALHRAGQSAKAAADARRYLAEHPDGFARGEARDLALKPKPSASKPGLQTP